MAYEKKEFDFILFINDGVEKNRPAVGGSIYINGKEIPIVGWNRTSKTGKKMIVGGKSVPREKTTKDDWEAHDAGNDIPF